jgi:uncharacterized protein
MQKSDRNEENNNKSARFSVAARACPQCGNEKTRRSSMHTSDGLLKRLFGKFYRCSTCRYRFWVIDPMRLVYCTGTLFLLLPVLGAVWMAYYQEPKVGSPVETVYKDQIKDLAEKGDPEAELKMALRHTSTARGIKDDRIAVQWFEKAARHDQIEAQYRYGLALLEGRGVVQDYKTAFYWLEKAARLGQAQAQATLGEMYHSGIAINGDIQRAYLWFNLAAAQGVESAVSSRDLVVKLLTPNQIAALQEEAIRISRGYRSLFVADESKAAVIKESDPVYEDSASADEPMPLVEESSVKAVILKLKDWWEKPL